MTFSVWFFYKFTIKTLPKYYYSLLRYNRDIYEIETRDHNQLHLFPTHTHSAEHVLRHHISKLINKFRRNITDRIRTHSIQVFFNDPKSHIIDFYTSVCFDPQCYVCDNKKYVQLHMVYVCFQSSKPSKILFLSIVDVELYLTNDVLKQKSESVDVILHIASPPPPPPLQVDFSQAVRHALSGSLLTCIVVWGH